MNEYLKNKAYQIKEFDSLLNSKIPLTTNEKKSFWIYRINQKKLPKNGFKIHISANINNAKNIAEIFFSYIDKYELNYKIVSSLQNLEKQNFGINGYSQVGKFITIYPVNKIQLQKTLFDLEILYKNFKSPNIPSDFSYMNSEVVYYRYGEFIINDEFKDRRDKKIPSKLRVPILDYTIPRYNQIPSKYIILEVIKKNFKGGIYKVFNTEKLNISILKEGSFQGNMDVYNVDSMNRVYWELLILKELKSESFSPNLLNYFYIGRSLFIEIEYIEGKTFKEILDISKQFSTERFILILNILVKLNTKYSISFRDISFENIIFNQEGSVKFIDFEYC